MYIISLSKAGQKKSVGETVGKETKKKKKKVKLALA
jgi:hypothetical protein